MVVISRRPFVFAAKKYGLNLYIDDEIIARDAEKVVTVVRVRKDR
jgi:hypothetical protein